jgi:hypothetical protein
MIRTISFIATVAVASSALSLQAGTPPEAAEGKFIARQTGVEEAGPDYPSALAPLTAWKRPEVRPSLLGQALRPVETAQGVTPPRPATAAAPQATRTRDRALPPFVPMLQDRRGNPSVPYIWSTGEFR